MKNNPYNVQLSDQKTIRNIILIDFLVFGVSEIAQSMIAQKGCTERSMNDKGIPTNNKIIGRPKRVSKDYFPKCVSVENFAHILMCNDIGS